MKKTEMKFISGLPKPEKHLQESSLSERSFEKLSPLKTIKVSGHNTRDNDSRSRIFPERCRFQWEPGGKSPVSAEKCRKWKQEYGERIR